MASGQPHEVLPQPRRVVLLPDGGGMADGQLLTDGQLLERFVTDRDETAFEVLVHRHGPMVLGVCRRLLHHAQDAEDAFQATFLVLVKKAASIRRSELLGNWLYGVAHRTALDARATATRKRARERQVSPMPDPETQDHADAGSDLRPLLDEELSRLPDRYRVAIVLCDLEGRTRQEAARALGIPVGTLSGRLTTARGRLARRLARRGLALSAAALTAAWSQATASEGVTPPLVASTVKAASAVAAGNAVKGVASAPVAALVERGLKAMLLRKLKLVTTVLLAAGVAIGAAAFMLGSERAPKEGAPRVLRLGDRGRRVVWSPDGKTLLVVTKVEKTFLGFQYDRRGSAVKVWDVETGKVKQTLVDDQEKGLAFQAVVFSADGRTIAATATGEVQRGNSLEIRDVIRIWNAKTLKLERTLGADSHLNLSCLALSPDGKLLVAGNPSLKTLTLWNVGSGALERTLKTGDAQPWSLAFSPDGKALVVGGQSAGHAGQVQVWDTQTWTVKHVFKPDGYVNTVAFAAGGRLVAAGGGGEVVSIWDAQKGELIRSVRGIASGTRSVAFSPDGRMLAAGSTYGGVRLWDVQTGTLTKTLQGHDAEVYSVAFSPDGKTLATTSQDQTLRLWPVSSPAAGSR